MLTFDAVVDAIGQVEAARAAEPRQNKIRIRFVLEEDLRVFFRQFEGMCGTVFWRDG